MDGDMDACSGSHPGLSHGETGMAWDLPPQVLPVPIDTYHARKDSGCALWLRLPRMPEHQAASYSWVAAKQILLGIELYDSSWKQISSFASHHGQTHN